nr:polysaccharide pyruvyl transferase family protein [Spiribacter sp. SSL99]
MVRGPLTRKVLRGRSIPCPESFGDPGLMLPEVFRPDTKKNKYALGVVPHFKEISIVERLFGSDFIGDEIRLIDPTQPIEEVIKQTLSCQAVVSSSLHGIIICHAYGIRCGWVRFSPMSAKVIDGDGIKFLDHLSAIGLKDFIRKPLSMTDADISVRRLLTHGLNSPVPDPTHLVDNVKKTCPFL